MKNGFIKVSCATPHIKVADCDYNTDRIIEIIKENDKKDVKLIAFPELCVTGYTCGDLFLQERLIKSAFKNILRIKNETENLDIISIVGAPIRCNGKLYNCAVVIKSGDILGIVPKTHIPNYSEFYEKRHFDPAPDENILVTIDNNEYLFGKKILFSDTIIDSFSFAVEICEDLWTPQPPSISHVIAGAKVIINISASDENIGKDKYRRNLVSTQSGSLICAYLYASAGEGESTTDLIFSGHNLICENGAILAESKLFENSVITSEIDVQKLEYERRRMTTFPANNMTCYEQVLFSIKQDETELTRFVDPYPFVPSSDSERAERCEAILKMQSLGLKKRIEHSYAKTVVLGISGGLDSSLALLVAVNAMDMLKRPHTDVVAVTMPCFGTTKRTKTNAEVLCDKLGVTLRTIDIAEAVNAHFKDISHDTENHNVVYENSQARERTQILMDVANQTNGLVVGTGDLSELALGWATYNGDHMSMYGVNASVPKTLIRHIIKYFADTVKQDELKTALYDILETPVSPELLPPKDGVISQVTEDIVGPYELHDFFLYYVVRFGFTPQKIYRLAVYAFNNKYDKETILKWLKVFYKRFFAQQFKRSCLPDSPKVGTVTLSPRGDWRMPSDACVNIWLDELESIN